MSNNCSAEIIVKTAGKNDSVWSSRVGLRVYISDPILDQIDHGPINSKACVLQFRAFSGQVGFDYGVKTG